MTDHPPLLRPYARQSLARMGETRDTSLSLESQLAVITDWAAANGFVVAAPIRDHDLKGDDPNRPGLAELEAQSQPGDTVAVYKFDRLARDVVLQESLVRRLQARNVQVISVTEPSTRLTRVIYGAVNEEFRDALSQRIRDTRKSLAMRGHYIGSNPHYGYQHSRERMHMLPDGTHLARPAGALEPNEAEAPVVVEIFERLAAGERPHPIAVDLSRRGIPTKRGSTWQIPTIKTIVRNRFYMGEIVYRGAVVADGVHEPLISRDLWERANRTLERPPKRLRSRTASSWLEGYVYHACGQRMYVTEIERHPNPKVSFGCRTAFQPVRCGISRRHISLRKLEAAVIDCLTTDLASIATVQDAYTRAAEWAGGVESVRKAQSLTERRSRVLARYERVKDAWASGIEALDWLADEQTKRDDDLAAIDAELASLPAAPDPARFAQIAARLTTIADVFAEADEPHRTALLAELGTVLVAPAGVSIRYDEDLRAFLPVPFVAAV